MLADIVTDDNQQWQKVTVSIWWIFYNVLAVSGWLNSRQQRLVQGSLQTCWLELVTFCCSSSLISSSWRTTAPHPDVSSSLLSAAISPRDTATFLRRVVSIDGLCSCSPELSRPGLTTEAVPRANKESVCFADGLRTVAEATSSSLDGSACSIVLVTGRSDVFSSSSGARSSWKPATSGLPWTSSSSSLQHNITCGQQ